MAPPLIPSLERLSVEAEPVGSETLLVCLCVRTGRAVVARGGSAEVTVGRGAAVGMGGARDGGSTVAMMLKD